MQNSIRLSREQITEYVHQWGSGSVVESLLNPDCKVFSSPGVEGFIGYLTNRRCVVAFGDPVCARSKRAQLVEAFHNFCEAQKKNAVYLVASPEFTTWMHNSYGCGWISFGKELFLDPQKDPRKSSGKKGITLRGKIRHAEKNRIVIQEYEGSDSALEEKIQEVASQWIKNREGPQIYISPVRLFQERFGKRWFYARQDNQLVGSLVLNQIAASAGWALDRIMIVPGAPQGTSEMLVLSVLEKIAAEGCRFLTFGAVNSATLDEIGGFGKGVSFLAPHLYKMAMKLFNIQARGKYWEKFQPESQPAFLVFKRPKLGPYEAHCLLRALNVSISP